MDNKKKKIYYGVLSGITIVLCLSFSIFLKVRERRLTKEAIETIGVVEEVTIGNGIVTQMPKEGDHKDTQKLKESQEKVEDIEDVESREVGMNVEEYENARVALQKELKESRPEFVGVTPQIEESFLKNDIDTFWEALGIYIISTFGSQKGQVVEFINMVDMGDNINCMMKIADSEGEQLFLLGSYNASFQYYEFVMTPDIYTFDDSLETGEGGL
jgi:hypothetical protein